MRQTLLMGLCGLLASPLGAQTMTMRPAEGAEVMAIAAGHVLVLRQVGSAVQVEGIIVDGGGATVVDVRREDRIVRLQGEPVRALPELIASYRGLVTGAMVTVRLARGGTEHEVRFPKPAASVDGRTMAVMGANAASGAGAWTTSAPGASSGELVIAGAHIRENSQGMPEVTHRSSHPAAATVPLRTGDVVTAVDGRSLAAMAGLEMLYANVAAGATVRFTVQRGSGSVEVSFAKPDAK